MMAIEKMEPLPVVPLPVAWPSRSVDWGEYFAASEENREKEVSSDFQFKRSWMNKNIV